MSIECLLVSGEYRQMDDEDGDEDGDGDGLGKWRKQVQKGGF
jgi:hypothetical protein